MPPKKASKEKEEYYEVEEIVEARVGKKANRKLQWDYNVKWKGFGPQQNTWEPEDSFQRAPESVRSFWRKADLNGRDHRSYKDFTKDEVVGLSPKGKKPAKLTASAKAKLKEKEKAPSASASAKGRSASARSASAKSKKTPSRASTSSRGRRRASARS